MPTSSVRRLAPALLVALALAGTACGDDGAAEDAVALEDVDSSDRADDSSDTTEPDDTTTTEGSGSSGGAELLAQLEKASADTLAVGSASVEMDISVVPDAAGVDAVTMTVNGVVDFTTGRAEFEMDLAQMLGDAAADPQLAEFLAEPVRVVQDGTTSYMCGSLFELVAGAECIRQEAAAAAGSASGFAGGLSFDALLATLGSLTDLEDLGDEQVLGAPMRHYSGSFSLADASTQLTPEQQAELEQSLGALGGDAGALDVPSQIDVWVDGDGLVRQVRQTTTIGAPVGMTTTMEIRYVELDVPVDIQIPVGAVDASTIPGF